MFADQPSSHRTELRVGLIGLDTSHVIAFTDIFNNPMNPAHVPGAKVIAAFKGGSPDVEASRTRVDGFTATLVGKYGVTLHPTIPELCRHVDAVMIESVDGRPHLAQAMPVLQARKPLFIDKPMAGSLRDVLQIFALADEHRTPVFSSSSLRFATTTQAVRHGSLGRVHYCETYSPAHLEPHHPDLFWYGIHGCEALYTVMGTGCRKVRRTTTADGRLEVTGFWSGNRFGVFREGKNGGFALGEQGRAIAGNHERYAGLLRAVVEFFRTGRSPVPREETIELFAFMEAADESKLRGGEWVEIDEILARARRPAKSR